MSISVIMLTLLVVLFSCSVVSLKFYQVECFRSSTTSRRRLHKSLKMSPLDDVDVLKQADRPFGYTNSSTGSSTSAASNVQRKLESIFQTLLKTKENEMLHLAAATLLEREEKIRISMLARLREQGRRRAATISRTKQSLMGSVSAGSVINEYSDGRAPHSSSDSDSDIPSTGSINRRHSAIVSAVKGVLMSDLQQSTISSPLYDENLSSKSVDGSPARSRGTTSSSIARPITDAPETVEETLTLTAGGDAYSGTDLASDAATSLLQLQQSSNESVIVSRYSNIDAGQVAPPLVHELEHERNSLHHEPQFVELRDGETQLEQLRLDEERTRQHVALLLRLEFLSRDAQDSIRQDTHNSLLTRLQDVRQMDRDISRSRQQAVDASRIEQHEGLLHRIEEENKESWLALSDSKVLDEERDRHHSLLRRQLEDGIANKEEIERQRRVDEDSTLNHTPTGTNSDTRTSSQHSTRVLLTGNNGVAADADGDVPQSVASVEKPSDLDCINPATNTSDSHSDDADLAAKKKREKLLELQRLRAEIMATATLGKPNSNPNP